MEQLSLNIPHVGDINTLYALLQADSYFLDRIDEIPFVNTPLHVAASTGNTQVAMEIMRLKSSLARKINQDGFSPLHLALQSRHDQLALRLLEIDGNLVRVKGREGINPLHYVAMEGNIDILRSFLSICPKSIEDVNIRNETALHVTLKNNMLGAFEFLVAWLQRASTEGAAFLEKKVLNWKDEEGNTALHIAVTINQPQIVRLLVNQKVDIHSKNLWGLTALGMAQRQNQSENMEMVVDILSHAQAVVGAPSLPIFDLFTQHLSTDEKLKKAAKYGLVDELYALLEEDPLLLTELAKKQVVDTPIHVAARNGRTHFAVEVARLRPSLAQKLNGNGASPMHLALKKGHIGIVRGLAKVDCNLIRVKGNGGITPLHAVVKKGDVSLLTELLYCCPSAVEDVTTRCQTALHLAVKNQKLGSLRVLFGFIHRVNKEEILHWKDDDGNTALHCAVDTKSLKATELLLNNVDNEAKNLRGLTAKQIFERQGQSQIPEMGIILNKASIVQTLLNSFIKRRDRHLGLIGHAEGLGGHIAGDVRNIVLVVAVLIATATYQAVLSPPGGYWSDNDPPHRAGKMIMGSWESSYFALLNTSAFCASVSTIIILTMGLPFAFFLEACMMFMTCSYFVSVFTIFPSLDQTTMFLLLMLGAILIFVQLVAFEVHRRQREKRNMGRGAWNL